MPHLAELRFGRGSTLASFRDLGSSLVNLRVLWLPACGVCHLDGVGALTALEELYLAFNDVEYLTSIALHDRLEVGEYAYRVMLYAPVEGLPLPSVGCALEVSTSVSWDYEKKCY